MALPSRHVLVLGIYNPDVDPQGLVLEKQKESARAKNLELSFWLVDGMNKSVDKIIPQLKTKLHEHEYQAIGIGLGIRGNAQLTPLFEGMINSIVRELPGTKFAFPQRPDDVVDAFVRVLSA